MAPKKRQRITTPEFSSDPIDPTGEHHTPKRVRVKQARIDGKSWEQIQEETKASRATQYRIFNGPTHRPGKQRTGAPCKLDVDTIAKMIKSLEGHYPERA